MLSEADFNVFLYELITKEKMTSDLVRTIPKDKAVKINTSEKVQKDLVKLDVKDLENLLKRVNKKISSISDEDTATYKKAAALKLKLSNLILQKKSV